MNTHKKQTAMMQKVYTCFTYGKPLIRNSRSPVRAIVKRAYKNELYTKRDQRRIHRLITQKQKSATQIEIYQSWIKKGKTLTT